MMLEFREFIRGSTSKSFPDWYQFLGPYVQFHGSKVQDKYEQIGDAIPLLLAFALAKEMVKSLPERTSE